MLRVCCRPSQSSVNLIPQHDANYSCSFVNTLCSSLFLLALDNRAQTQSHVQEKYFLCARARVTKSLPQSNLIPSLAFSVRTTFVYTGGGSKSSLAKYLCNMAKKKYFKAPVMFWMILHSAERPDTAGGTFSLFHM